MLANSWPEFHTPKLHFYVALPGKTDGFFALRMLPLLPRASELRNTWKTHCAFQACFLDAGTKQWKTQDNWFVEDRNNSDCAVVVKHLCKVLLYLFESVHVASGAAFTSIVCHCRTCQKRIGSKITSDCSFLSDPVASESQISPSQSMTNEASLIRDTRVRTC